MTTTETCKFCNERVVFVKGAWTLDSYAGPHSAECFTRNEEAAAAWVGLPHEPKAEARYFTIGGQRIREDKCPQCGHTGHAAPCQTTTHSLSLVTGEHGESVACTCTFSVPDDEEGEHGALPRQSTADFLDEHIKIINVPVPAPRFDTESGNPCHCVHCGTTYTPAEFECVHCGRNPRR